MQVQAEYLCGWFLSHFNVVINGIELIVHRIENPVQIMPFKTWKQIVCISSVSLLPSEVRLPLEWGPAAPYAWLTTLPFLVAYVWCLLLVLLIYMYFFNLTWIPLKNVSCLPDASWLTVHIQPNYLDYPTDTDC